MSRLFKPVGLFRPDIEAILADAGFVRCLQGEPGVRFFLLDKWLIRSGRLPYFLQRMPRLAKRLLGFRSIRFRASEGVNEYPLILIREKGRPKVSFFSPANRTKRVTWVYRNDFERELLGIRHFARPPSRIAPLVGTDGPRQTVYQGFVGRFLGPTVPLGQLVEFLIPVYAALKGENAPARDYLAECRRILEAGGRTGNSLPTGLEPAMEFLQELAESGRLPAVMQGVSHGDMSPSNALLSDDGNLHLVDFDLAALRSLGYDFAFLHLTCPEFGSARLTAALRELSDAAGGPPNLEDQEIYLSTLALFILDLGCELKRRTVEVEAEKDRRPAIREMLLVEAAARFERELATGTKEPA